MKIVLANACGLMLVWAQALAVSTPVVDRTAARHCGCGGTMPCCRAASASHSIPLDATSSSASQHILSPVPAAVVWVLAAPSRITEEMLTTTSRMQPGNGRAFYFWRI